MHKIYLSAVVLFALNIGLAKANTARDSIGVENNNGKKLIVHQVVAKDTYYSIGRRYNVSPKDIMAFNENKYLQLGVIIKVPTNLAFGGAASPANATANNSSPLGIIEHTVKAKENLNLLAEKYGSTINDIKTLNNLSGNNLSIGQVLKIQPKGSATSKTAETVATTVKKTEAAPVETQSTDSQTLIEHEVKPKEFLGKIAEKYGTTVEEVKKANNLTNNNLRIGQKLKIPATKNIEEDKVLTTAAQETPADTKSNDTPGTHTVLRNETIFTIAKQYGTTAYQLRRLNNLSDNAITIGQVLKVPGGIVTEVQVPKEHQAEQAKQIPASPSASSEDSFIHTVVNGENIFTIAKKYNLTAYQIRQANKLNDNAIKPDQKLIIPKPPQPKSVNEASKEDQENESDSTSVIRDPKLRRDPSVYGLSQIEEKGVAVWISDADLDGAKMLVLHRTAPVGRVIKITNPMTNRTTFAKVVGKFTENESTKDVIIVMTKAVADSLGALDKRFFCNLTYSAQ